MNSAMKYINHNHPAAKAAMITSNAFKAVYFDRYEARTQKELKAALKAATWIERVHARVNDSLVRTPDAWMEIAA